MGIFSIATFVISNLPTIIKIISTLLSLFDGDKKAAKECAKGMACAIEKAGKGDMADMKALLKKKDM